MVSASVSVLSLDPRLAHCVGCSTTEAGSCGLCLLSVGSFVQVSFCSGLYLGDIDAIQAEMDDFCIKTLRNAEVKFILTLHCSLVLPHSGDARDYSSTWAQPRMGEYRHSVVGQACRYESGECHGADDRR